MVFTPESFSRGLPLLYFAVRINPSRVYFLKFILEGYDNMFIVTTLNPGDGTLLVRAAAGCMEELYGILESVREQTGFICIEEVDNQDSGAVRK